MKKTDELVAKLDVKGVGGNLRARFGSHNNADIVFLTENPALAESLTAGIKAIAQRKPPVFELSDPSKKIIGYQFKVPATMVQAICKTLKLDYELIKNEIASRGKFEDTPIDNLSFKR